VKARLPIQPLHLKYQVLLEVLVHLGLPGNRVQQDPLDLRDKAEQREVQDLVVNRVQ
jgi:hypothetical protein